MANIRYDPGETPKRGKHTGYTFIANRCGNSMLPAQRNARKRYPNQHQRQHNLMHAVRFWREMSPATKANWNTFAATYPQASHRNPAKFLSGYQLFLKRSHYCFLNHEITTDFMTEPELISLDVPDCEFTLAAGKNQIDVTELYIANFGILPKMGDWLQVVIYPIATFSGQFFAPIELKLEVLEVFIDGLFLSINFIVPPDPITFSVYLSRSMHRSSYYSKSNLRYMGCFTAKEFNELTDVPEITPADAGKVWGVTPEGVWDLISTGGGGGGNAFNPIVVAGQTSLTANQAAEPLTVVAGSNITLVTNNTSKTLTVSAASGGGGGANFGSYKAFSDTALNVQQYVSTGVPGSYSQASFKCWLTVINPDNTYRDFMEWILWVRGTTSILSYNAKIITPLTDASWFGFLNAAYASGSYQIGFKYSGSLLTGNSRLLFGWQLIGSYFAKSFPANLP